MVALASIYVPLDGMNEKGLCVSDLIEIDGSTEVPDTDKADLTIVAAIRLVLDYAKDTEEAVKLLSEYDVFPSVNAHKSISVTPSGIVISLSEVQPENALLSIFVTELGIVILSSEVQPSKA